MPGTRGVMARKKKKAVKRSASRTAKPKRATAAADTLVATVKGATHRYVGHVRLDVGRAGAARVKRMIYPAGFRWSKDMKPVVGTLTGFFAEDTGSGLSTFTWTLTPQREP